MKNTFKVTVILFLLTTLFLGEILAEPASNSKIYDVHDFGAKGDGATDDTKAIQAAINVCKGTNGTISLKDGDFLSGSLEMGSNMIFYVDKSAKLLGIPYRENIYKYYPDVVPNYETRTHKWARRCLIHGFNLNNFTLTGDGTIDLQAQSWEKEFVEKDLSEQERPLILLFHRCNNINIKNVKLQNTVTWCSAFDQCKNLVVENLEIYNDVIENNDGINIIDCKHVKILNNKIWADDDNICLKSMCSVGIKDVLIQGNILYSARANGIKLGTDSSGPVEDVRIINNKVFFARQAGLAWEAVDGTHTNGLYVSKLEMIDVAVPIFIIVADRGRGGFPLGSIQNVVIENVKVYDSSQTGMCISGMPESKIRNLTIRDCQFHMGGAWKLPVLEPEEAGKKYPEADMFGILPAYGFYIRYAEHVKLEQIEIGYLRGDLRPWLVTKDVQNLVRNDITELGKIKPKLFNSPEWKTPFIMSLSELN